MPRLEAAEMEARELGGSWGLVFVGAFVGWIFFLFLCQNMNILIFGTSPALGVEKELLKSRLAAQEREIHTIKTEHTTSKRELAGREFELMQLRKDAKEREEALRSTEDKVRLQTPARAVTRSHALTRTRTRPRPVLLHWKAARTKRSC